MLAKLRKDLAEADYGTLGLEVVVVIAGILIAFQIDRWGQEGRERQQEYQYLLRLKNDLQFEVDLMEQSLRLADRRIAAVQLLERVVADPKIAPERPYALAHAIESATWRSFPYIGAIVFTELQSTGNLSLIESDSLRQDLVKYYAFLRFESAVSQNLESQNQFTKVTRGILSTAELVNIQQSGSEGHRRIEISPDRALEIARDLAGRQDAIDLLPSIVQHHTFNKMIIADSREQAQQITAALDSLIEGFDY